GLIANTLFKDHWGRARPAQIEAFGGTRQFTPAPLPAAQCDRNCAFVSGHAAFAFSLVSFAFLLPLGWRRKTAVAAALGFGSLVEILAIGWIERPLAAYFREAGGPWRPFFEWAGPFGLAMPYLILFGLAFVVLRWGGSLPPLQPWAMRMRGAARIPALLFSAV